MYTTVYNVLVGDNTVACGLFSLDEAEYIRDCWLDVFPYLKICIQSVTVSFKSGDFVV